jgi:hypothetical protein
VLLAGTDIQAILGLFLPRFSGVQAVECLNCTAKWMEWGVVVVKISMELLVG